MSSVFVGDVGTELVVDCGVDVSTATVRKLLVRKPSGQEVEWVAAAGPTITTIKYVVQAGDLNVNGYYAVQSYISMPGWSGRGTKATLEVLK